MTVLCKASFTNGTLLLHGPAETLESGQLLAGYVELQLQERLFVRGVWVKLVAKSKTINESTDLLKDQNGYHIDGIHVVFVGFGEGDIDNGALLEMAPGRYTWNYHINLPENCPLSYCDEMTDVSYKITAVFDSAGIPLQHSTATCNLIVDHLHPSSLKKITKQNNDFLRPADKAVSPYRRYGACFPLLDHLWQSDIGLKIYGKLSAWLNTDHNTP
jgi:hypothetical protein